MTTLPPSASEPVVSEIGAPNVSSAFARLDVRVQRWIWEQNWSELRDVQEEAIHALLDGDRDIILASPTASGKTEAAFLPICSQLAGNAGQSVRALYVSPLKALINDQFPRIERLCEQLAIPVHRWHGDVPASRKHALVNHPSGILLITPESLEALFVLRGHKIASIFGQLAYIVVDELHSFIGTERGRQTQSLLHRLEAVIKRRVPRIGLSATLGDMRLSADFLRPRHADEVYMITSNEEGQPAKIQLRGYTTSAVNSRNPATDENEPAGVILNEDIAAHLYDTLRYGHHLIFPNRRQEVELYADWLRLRCEADGLPASFLPHHGSLSKTLREDAEARLKNDASPASLICTTTLELGIDVGNVASVAQIGIPPTVASLRQRVGRSGRRGDAAILRVYVTEDSLECVPPNDTDGTKGVRKQDAESQEDGDDPPPQDAIRANLVQSIATIQLMIARWTEPPPDNAPHPSTLVQQTLSYIAQCSGATAPELWHVLCETGPFASIDRRAYALFLRSLAGHDLLTQMPEGTLLLGKAGERIVNDYHFYAAFSHSEEYRLLTIDGQTLGTLPVTRLPAPGSHIVFAGRRWRIININTANKMILLAATEKWGLVNFDGIGGLVHDRVRQEMRRIYMSDDVPAFLDTKARLLLAEGRARFVAYRLDTQPLVPHGKNTVLFCWHGDRVLHTLAAQLRSIGVSSEEEGHALTVSDIQPPQLVFALRQLAAQGKTSINDLLPFCGSLMTEKHDIYAPPDMRGAHYAARYLDTLGAWDTLIDALDLIQN